MTRKTRAIFLILITVGAVVSTGGIGVILATTLIVAAAGIAFALLTAPKQNSDGMNPASLDDFAITQAKEGLVVPYVFGRVRTPGNIIYYGNLQTQEVKTKAGGKGGGDEEVTEGFKYFLDIWQSLCMGKVTIQNTYINDKDLDVTATNTIFNDGKNGLVPSFITGSNQIKGVAHVAYQQMFLGVNVTTVPTIHFVVNRVIEVAENPVNNANLTNGTNPAAAVYDVLITAGVQPFEIDLPSFNTAAAFWNAAGIGINLKFDTKQEAGTVIQTILNYTDGVLYRDDAGKYLLRAIDPNDSSVSTISEQDMEAFVLIRDTWRHVPNKFRATFVDESQDFTQRGIIAENPAAIVLAGYEIQRNIDMKAFRDINTAAKRLFEIMKRESYPALNIRFRTSLANSTIKPGDVITVSHSDYGIVSAEFRVTKVQTKEVDKNEVEVTARQLVEKLHDAVFVAQGGSEFANLNPVPILLTKIKVFELPYNEATLGEPAFMVLASREKGFETGADYHVSDQATQDFENFGTFTTFAQQGTLAQAYPSTTRQIDDVTGIEYTPYKSFDSPETINRAQLFAVQRVAIIGNEMVAFEKVQPQGGGTIKLLGVRRGLGGTPVESHSSGAEIYIAFFANNVLQKVRFETFYLKVQPRFRGNLLDLSSITAINISTTYKARKPRKPGRIVATRTGSNISVVIYPSSPGIRGAGDAFPVETDQPRPFAFLGDFKVTWTQDTTGTIVNADNFNITQAAATTINVSSRINNHIGDALSVVVPATDGTYKA